MSREHVEPVGNIGRGDELAVRLVEHDEAVRRHALEESRQRRAIDRRARRVVGVAHEHEPRALADRVTHRVEVVSLLEQRNPHGRGAELLREDRIHLERRPREHHLVAVVDGGGEREPAQVHGARADQDLRRVHGVVRGERVGERRVPIVRVAVDAGDGVGDRGRAAGSGPNGASFEASFTTSSMPCSAATASADRPGT